VALLAELFPTLASSVLPFSPLSPARIMSAKCKPVRRWSNWPWSACSWPAWEGEPHDALKSL